MADTKLLNVRVPEQVLEQLDETYEERGFTSRSEFVRKAIRDAMRAESVFTEETRDDAAGADETLDHDEALAELDEPQSHAPSPDDD